MDSARSTFRSTVDSARLGLGSEEAAAMEVPRLEELPPITAANAADFPPPSLNAFRTAASRAPADCLPRADQRRIGRLERGFEGLCSGSSSAHAELSMTDEERALQEQLETRAAELVWERHGRERQELQERLERCIQEREMLILTARRANQEVVRLQSQLAEGQEDWQHGARTSTPPKTRPREELREELEEHPSGGRAPHAPGLASERKERKGNAQTARASMAARIDAEEEDLALNLAKEMSLAVCGAEGSEDVFTMV